MRLVLFITNVLVALTSIKKRPRYDSDGNFVRRLSGACYIKQSDMKILRFSGVVLVLWALSCCVPFGDIIVKGVLCVALWKLVNE